MKRRDFLKMIGVVVAVPGTIIVQAKTAIEPPLPDDIVKPEVPVELHPLNQFCIMHLQIKAGESIEAGAVCCVGRDGLAYKAKQGDSVYGIAQVKSKKGKEVGIVKDATFRDSPNIVPSKPYYLSSVPGKLTSNPNGDDPIAYGIGNDYVRLTGYY